jgi:hypothetical protein
MTGWLAPSPEGLGYKSYKPSEEGREEAEPQMDTDDTDFADKIRVALPGLK